MDGLLGAAQDLMRKVKKPSAIHFMFYVNSWSSPIAILALLITGEIPKFVEFCVKFPIINLYLAIFLGFGCLGQYFMASLISHFGSLPFSLTMTTRKFFTVLFSVFVFKNSFDLTQWLATLIIFIALLLNIFFGKKKENNEVQKDEEKCEEEKDFIGEKIFLK
jgi:UDP-galactose transporter B1